MFCFINTFEVEILVQNHKNILLYYLYYKVTKKVILYYSELCLSTIEKNKAKGN